MPAPSYSPRLRTGVLLCGSGTAGVYQAGVLRALTEAGVKVDVLLAHGVGVVTALCAAIDGGARLWDPGGPWLDARLQRAYRWRPALRVAGWGLMAAAVLLVSPLLVLVAAAGLYVASLVASLANLTNAAAWLVGAYGRLLDWLLAPPILPTIVPRAVLLAVLVVVAVLVTATVRAAARERSRRRLGGAIWWRLVGSPLDAREPAALFVETIWALVRGASAAPKPPPDDLGRRFVEVLTDNLGQPGFREVVLAVHDLDARRDLVGAVLGADGRGPFGERRRGAGPREAESLDCTGPARRNLVDLLQGSLRLPVATEPHVLTFTADGYWRGERHRVCDRPELAVRLIDEAAALGIEQVVIVTPAAPPAVRHGMRMRPGDLRARMGETLRSVETAAVEDAVALATARFSGVFVVRPDHNPILPFSFSGVYDEASDRRRDLAELMQQGYDDAYRQFIEPMVATGERTEL